MALDLLQQYDKKLEKVNSIIQKIAAETKNITPMLPADYALFDEFFDKEERHTYGNSWIYVTQGTYGIGPEKLGYKYHDGENLCTMAIFPKLEQPDIIMLYWIRPLGPGMMPIIAKLAEEIKQKYGICSYVKKLFPDQYEYLLQHGFRSAKEFPWHSSAHSEDDTYPELIFDREKTCEAIAEAVSRSKLGNTFRKTLKLARENIIETTCDDFQESAWQIVNTYFRRHGEFARGINISTPFDYYNIIFQNLSRKKNNVTKQIVLVNKAPAGFYALEQNKNFNYTCLFASIMLRQDYKYLMDHFFISMLNNETTQFINVGGSEDEGLHAFKNKFKPLKQKIMFWATNYSL